MRRAALLFVIAVFACAANAQFTLTPQFGFEVPKTQLSYNHQPFFTPQSQFSGQLGIRGDYKFKGGFGPFLTVTTHRPIVEYYFSDPMTGMTDYDAKEGNMMVQFQTGLQYTSKPILLSKKSTTKETVNQSTYSKGHCCRSSCGSKHSETKTTKTTKTDEWTMRLLPSAGIGYIPSGKPDLEQGTLLNSAGYTYNAGNMATEYIGGMGFEFAHNKKKVLTLSVNYFQGTKTNETGFTTPLGGGKEEITTLRSKISGWNMSLGIPITFAKKSPEKKTQAKTQKNRGGCYYYKSRCGGY